MRGYPLSKAASVRGYDYNYVIYHGGELNLARGYRRDARKHENAHLYDEVVKNFDVILKQSQSSSKEAEELLKAISFIVYFESHVTASQRGGGAVAEFLLEGLLAYAGLPSFEKVTYDRETGKGIAIWGESMSYQTYDEFEKHFLAYFVE